MRIIISRHKATVEWLKTQIGDVDVLSQVDHIEDIPKSVREVYGNLPLSLITQLNSKGIKYYAVEFDEYPPRGVDLTPEKLEKYGVKVVEYVSFSRIGFDQFVEKIELMFLHNTPYPSEYPFI